jgi:hypothetical protein
MRRIIFGLVMLWAALFGACQASAFYNSRDSNYNISIASGGGAPTWNPSASGGTGIQEGIGFHNSVTFTGINIGTAASNRIVVLCFGANATNGPGTTATVNGTSLTQAAIGYDGLVGNAAFLFYGNVPTGTSATIVITDPGPGNPYNDVGIAVGALYNVTATPSGGTSNYVESSGSHGSTITYSGALTVPSTGFGIACTFADNNNTTIPTWNSPMGDDINQPGTVIAIDLAHSSTAGSLTPSASSSTGAYYGAAAAWGP